MDWKKLAKLIPLLSSDQVGEVAAAASAINKHLKAEGCNWHDLTARVVYGDQSQPLLEENNKLKTEWIRLNSKIAILERDLREKNAEIDLLRQDILRRIFVKSV